MNRIIDYKDLPGINICARAIIDGQHPRIEALDVCEREDMARSIAAMIVGNPKFYHTQTLRVGGGELIQIDAECMVLTRDELLTFAMELFQRGKQSVLNPRY